MQILTIKQVKCEGFDNPPCVRCNKSGKECQFIVLEKIRNHDASDGPPRKRARVSGSGTTSVSPAHTPIAQQTNRIPQWTAVQSNSARALVSAKTSNTAGSVRGNIDSATALTVPSLYSTSPLDAVNEPNANHARNSSLQKSNTSEESRSRDQQTIWRVTNGGVFHDPDLEVKVPKKDMRGMIKM